MELVVAIVLSVSGGLTGLMLAWRAKGETTRLRARNDVLEARDAECRRELRLALSAADDQGRALSAARQTGADLLAALNHEMRTPLNAVVGLSESMRMNAAFEPLTWRQGQAVEQILTAGRQMLSLIEAVLVLSRIQTGNLTMVIEPFDPNILASQVCAALASEAAAAGVQLRPPPPTACFEVMADRTRLHQLVLTLVSNAIKHNRPGGRVVLDVRRTTDGVALLVHDTGVGIPQARMADLFQPLDRPGRETAAAGTGFGLALSRRLAEAMGGSLHAVSKEGEGSTFTVRMPLAQVTASPSATAVERPRVAVSLNRLDLNAPSGP